jgi:hypothetical protein
MLIVGSLPSNDLEAVWLPALGTAVGTGRISTEVPRGYLGYGLATLAILRPADTRDWKVVRSIVQLSYERPLSCSSA